MSSFSPELTGGFGERGDVQFAGEQLGNPIEAEQLALFVHSLPQRRPTIRRVCLRQLPSWKRMKGLGLP